MFFCGCVLCVRGTPPWFLSWVRWPCVLGRPALSHFCWRVWLYSLCSPLPLCSPFLWLRSLCRRWFFSPPLVPCVWKLRLWPSSLENFLPSVLCVAGHFMLMPFLSPRKPWLCLPPPPLCELCAGGASLLGLWFWCPLSFVKRSSPPPFTPWFPRPFTAAPPDPVVTSFSPVLVGLLPSCGFCPVSPCRRVLESSRGGRDWCFGCGCSSFVEERCVAAGCFGLGRCGLVLRKTS